MKKLVGILILAALTMSACGGTQAPKDQKQPTETPTPLVIQMTIANVTWKESKSGRDTFGTLLFDVTITNTGTSGVAIALSSLAIRTNEGNNISISGFIKTTSSEIAPGETIKVQQLVGTLKGTTTAQELIFKPLGKSQIVGRTAFPEYTH
jgi:hypothetical protein